MEKIFTDEIILDIYEEELFDRAPRSDLSQKLKIEKDRVLSVLKETLTEKQKELFLEYLNLSAEEKAETDFEIFKRGFLRGVSFYE